MDKNEEFKALMAESDALIQEGLRYLEMNGIKYNLKQWVTIKEYTRRYNLDSTSVVSNWISRGVIPPENVITIPDLNNIKLIKAIPYKES